MEVVLLLARGSSRAGVVRTIAGHAVVAEGIDRAAGGVHGRTGVVHDDGARDTSGAAAARLHAVAEVERDVAVVEGDVRADARFDCRPGVVRDIDAGDDTFS